MKKLIALCDGHGMETEGKRTPTGIKSKETGANFMRENEFNRAVVSGLDVHLKRCGFDTLLVAPTDQDIPLKHRTDLANANKADLYLSIHANAVGTGEWNSVRGIETFHYTKPSEASKKYAAIIHKHLIGGTKLPDRGVKSADFHVLRETTMPAVLAECGFMTNKEDAVLLLSDEYRKECAEELAKAVCEIYDVPYAPQPNTKYIPIKIDLIDTKNNKTDTVDGFAVDGISYIPVRASGAFFEAKVGYDSSTKKASLTK